jgi:hypothetical protein
MIRAYNENDYDEVCSWWQDAGEQGPLPGMMTEDGSFIFEFAGEAVMSLTCYYTQSNIGYIEGFIAKPGTPKAVRDIGGKLLWQRCYEHADGNGVEHVMTYSKEAKLVKRYEKFGMQKLDIAFTPMYRKLGA